MALPPERHLTSEDFQALTDGFASLGVPLSREESAELESHLDVCTSCSRMLLAYKRAQEQVESISRTAPVSIGASQCPDESEWERLRELPESRMNAVLDHAMDCRACSSLVTILTGQEEPVTHDEEELIVSLPSSTRLGQQDIAGRLAPKFRTRRFRLLPLLAAAAVVLVAFAVWWQRRVPDTTALLARAYAESRPMDFRLLDGSYGPVNQTKGAATLFSLPASLRQAIDIIDHGLSRKHDDPGLLRQKAQAELLELSFTDAISVLGALYREHPEDDANWLPLACAYYLRAASQPDGDARDYARALDLLDRLLRIRPGDPVVLFNTGLVHEKLHEVDAAIDSWKRFLDVDSTSGFAAEARKKIEELQAHNAARLRILNLVGGPPEGFLGLIKNGTAVSSELFLDTALTTWLPAMRTNVAAREATQQLAALLQKQCGDPYLSEMIREPLPEAGVNALSDAIRLNHSADPLRGVVRGREAVMAFRSINRAGEFRALTEVLYALHRSAAPQPCLTAAVDLEDVLRPTSFAWMKTQVLVEKSICQAYLGDFADAMENAAVAQTQAVDSHLPSLRLRAAEMLTNHLRQIGNIEAVWRMTPLALDAYWGAPHPPGLAFQSYVDLAESASRLALPFAARGFRKAAVEAVSQMGEPLLEATARSNLSLSARKTGNLAEAKREEEESRSLIDRAPDTRLRRDYIVDANLFRASQDVEEGRTQVALPLLEQLRASDVPANTGRLRALDTLALALWTSGDPHRARDVAAEAATLERKSILALPLPVDRMVAAERHSEATRILAEVQVSRDLDIYGAFVTLQARRAMAAASWAGFSPLEGLAAQARVSEWTKQFTHESFLSLVDLPGGPAAWLMDDRGLAFTRLGVPRAVVESRVDALVRLCADSRSDPRKISDGAAELFKIIFAPLGRRLQLDRTLVIDADALFAKVPFAVVLSADSAAFVRSAGVAEYLERSGSEKIDLIQSSLLLVSAPVVAPSLRRFYPLLSDASGEASDVSDYFPRRTLLSGLAARPSAVIAGLSGAEVFHFSGHGSGDAGNGALVLSPEDVGRPFSGFLTSSQIRRLNLRKCQLVVLSACATATGEEQGPVNPDSLVRSMLQSGGRRVIASQWSVPASATRQLMAAFYKHLSTGVGTAGALRRAEAELRAAASTSHPFYWAAFQLFGYR